MPDAATAHGQAKIAHDKVPLKIRAVDEFVMTATGKARRVEMRGMIEAELTGCG